MSGLGHSVTIPSRKNNVLLAGGTRERGSPSATAITAPVPGALLTGLVAALGPACPFGSLCSRVPGAISVGAMRLGRTPFRGAVAQFDVGQPYLNSSL